MLAMNTPAVVARLDTGDHKWLNDSGQQVFGQQAEHSIASQLRASECMGRLSSHLAHCAFRCQANTNADMGLWAWRKAISVKL